MAKKKRRRLKKSVKRGCALIIAVPLLICLGLWGKSLFKSSSSETPAEAVESACETEIPESPNNLKEIGQALERLYSQSLRLDTTNISVEVYDIDSDSVVFSRHAHRLVPPASCMKLLTAVTAIEILGIDHCYTSQVVACGQQEGSTFNGILHIRLDDDPMLESLESMADAIRRRGIRQVKGDIVFDLTRDDTLKAHSSASAWDIPYNKLPILLKGRQRIEQEFRYQMAAKGISLKRETVAGHEEEGTILYEQRTPLTDVITPMLIHSSNIKADALFHHIAQTCNRQPFLSVTPTDCMRALAGIISPNHEFVINDGSGLSPDNRLTVHFLTGLLRYAWEREPIRRYFIDEALATPGHPVRYGSLLSRMRGEPFEGRVFVKTGTLTTKGLSSLAGFAQGSDGRWRIFAIVNEDSPVAESRIFQDSLCKILVQ